jgi:hypothetical protein
MPNTAKDVSKIDLSSIAKTKKEEKSTYFFSLNLFLIRKIRE